MTNPSLPCYRSQRSWGKVIFSVVCVKNSVHSGGVPGQVPPGQVHLQAGKPPCAGTPPGQIPPPAGIPPGRYTPLTPPPGQVPPWSMSGRYASYWNAFFVQNHLMVNNFFDTRIVIRDKTFPKWLRLTRYQSLWKLCVRF